MGEPTPHSPVLRLLIVWTRYPQALAWARARAELTWGPVALASEAFPFTSSNYYAAEMGTDLAKTFLFFERRMQPETMAVDKLLTNGWEAEYAQLGRHAEARPLNLDPGYLTQAKLVLASTKDHAHRIYLGEGIYAEVTLFFKHGHWQSHPLTFPDFREERYHAFLTEARDLLRRRQSPGGSDSPGGSP